MKKILILGVCGAGKSTLARQLHEKIQLPVIHLDQAYWKPNWVEPTEEEWRAKVTQLVQGDSWIMEGNYSGTWDIRMPLADTIIYLDFPTYLSLYRITKRTLQYHGTSRPDMTEGCPERFDWEFFHYVLVFNLTRRKRNLAAIEKVKTGKSIFILQSPREVEQFLSKIDHAK